MRARLTAVLTWIAAKLNAFAASHPWRRLGRQARWVVRALPRFIGWMLNGIFPLAVGIFVFLGLIWLIANFGGAAIDKVEDTFHEAEYEFRLKDREPETEAERIRATAEAEAKATQAALDDIEATREAEAKATQAAIRATEEANAEATEVAEAYAYATERANIAATKQAEVIMTATAAAMPPTATPTPKPTETVEIVIDDPDLTPKAEDPVEIIVTDADTGETVIIEVVPHTTPEGR